MISAIWSLFQTVDNWLHNRFDSVDMKRRLIPMGIGLFAFGVCVSTAFEEWVSENLWIEWTAFVLSGLFLFKSFLFFWMRQTMIEQTRKLTIFGWALCDFFLAITLGDLFLTYTFALAWWALHNSQLTPSFSWRVFGRSGLIGASFFVISTGVAVGFEMKKAAGHVRVHEEILDIPELSD